MGHQEEVEFGFYIHERGGALAMGSLSFVLTATEKEYEEEGAVEANVGCLY